MFTTVVYGIFLSNLARRDLTPSHWIRGLDSVRVRRNALHRPIILVIANSAYKQCTAHSTTKTEHLEVTFDLSLRLFLAQVLFIRNDMDFSTTSTIICLGPRDSCSLCRCRPIQIILFYIELLNGYDSKYPMYFNNSSNFYVCVGLDKSIKCKFRYVQISHISQRFLWQQITI